MNPIPNPISALRTCTLHGLRTPHHVSTSTYALSVYCTMNAHQVHITNSKPPTMGHPLHLQTPHPRFRRQPRHRRRQLQLTRDAGECAPRRAHSRAQVRAAHHIGADAAGAGSTCAFPILSYIIAFGVGGSANGFGGFGGCSCKIARTPISRCVRQIIRSSTARRSRMMAERCLRK